MTTFLHTLNSDIQGLLSQRLLEPTLESLSQFPVYLLQHTKNGVVTENGYVCLGDQPQISILAIASHLVKDCGGLYHGWVKAYNQHSAYIHQLLDDILKRKPEFAVEYRKLHQQILAKRAEEELSPMIPLPSESCHFGWVLGDAKYHDWRADIITQGRTLIIQHLTSEDLIPFLHLPDVHDGVSFVRLKSTQSVTYY